MTRTSAAVLSRRIALTAVVAAVLLAATLRAHDSEQTQVTLNFAPDGQFDLVVSNDANWLLLRLERFDPESQPTIGSLSPAERDARLAALSQVFMDRVVLFVDGHEVRPESVTYEAPGRDANGEPARNAAYHLRGWMPLTARSLRWYYGLVVDPYPLAVRRADTREVSETVLGDAWSGPIDLAGQFIVASPWDVTRRYATLALTSILPRGPEHILFLLGLLLLGPASRAWSMRLAVFAVALSASLSMCTLGSIELPDRALEVLVALSIVWIALDCLLARRARAWQLVPIVAAGIVHGASLAQHVLDTSPFRDDPALIALALNLGAAGGQLAVAGLGLLCLASYGARVWYRRRIVVPASIALACAGAYWTLVRATGV